MVNALPRLSFGCREWSLSGVRISVVHREATRRYLNAKRLPGRQRERRVAQIDSYVIDFAWLDRAWVRFGISETRPQDPSDTARAVPSGCYHRNLTTQSASGVSALTHNSARGDPATINSLRSRLSCVNQNILPILERGSVDRTKHRRTRRRIPARRFNRYRISRICLELILRFVLARGRVFKEPFPFRVLAFPLECR